MHRTSAAAGLERYELQRISPQLGKKKVTKLVALVFLGNIRAMANAAHNPNSIAIGALIRAKPEAERSVLTGDDHSCDASV
jgi:hypothetical protein